MYAYDSFGCIYERDGTSRNYRPFQTSRVNHNRFFTNREYDTDLQLYYYRARWYSPALGRFMSRDPLGYADGVNIYAYVWNNPTTYVDPWGTEKQLLPGPSREWKSFKEMTWAEVGNKIYDQWDWQELGNKYIESSNQFAQPFVDTAQCFQEDVFVCSVETFTLYGDVVVIDEYVTNFDDVTLWQKVGNWALVVWAIITPGNKKTNQWLKSQAKDIIQTVNSLAVEANFKRFMSKIPANAKSNVKITTSANNITTFTATSPWKVPWSYAIYEKRVDASWNTISYLKTTVDPNGNIIHTKDKMNN